MIASASTTKFLSRTRHSRYLRLCSLCSQWLLLFQGGIRYVQVVIWPPLAHLSRGFSLVAKSRLSLLANRIPGQAVVVSKHILPKSPQKQAKTSAATIKKPPQLRGSLRRNLVSRHPKAIKMPFQLGGRIYFQVLVYGIRYQPIFQSCPSRRSLVARSSMIFSGGS